MLVCFAGLLRVGELIKLRLGDINCIKDDWAVLTLPDSKGAKRGGKPESVIIRDVTIVRMLKKSRQKVATPIRFTGEVIATSASACGRRLVFSVLNTQI